MDKKIKPIRKISYKSGTDFKYENTKVSVFPMTTNDFVIQLKLRSDDHSVRAYHRVDRNKIVVTGIRISPEAAISIMVGLQEELVKAGYLKNN